MMIELEMQRVLENKPLTASDVIGRKNKGATCIQHVLERCHRRLNVVGDLAYANIELLPDMSVCYVPRKLPAENRYCEREKKYRECDSALPERGPRRNYWHFPAFRMGGNAVMRAA